MLPDLSRPALDVAPLLVGCRLQAGPVTVRLVEVEAYEGSADPASHAYRGRTSRNAVMFGPSGHLYVYTLHGSVCCNVVCGPEGTATAVLLRAGEVEAGREVARARRLAHRGSPLPDRDLARGPGNLCRALGITAADNGADLLGGGALQLLPAERCAMDLSTGPRVNVSTAADRPWRFWDASSGSVSLFKRHPQAANG
ncbi:DNA-3-methyladenine glycosylase [Raineyella sp. LH-20]|uniref:DNA-3-methyladenine glycosylase n=1 Tax=Raineyella sp. LH-20 TaxID=3081204 RepID=UPI002953C8F2|nr:DNA-3-methyladenine glycosylase [Raineyella sp. LH-20]WOP18319.1 DNA-3-methyladenine glycosylase [Raineyella sp. LH-20]